MALKSLNSRPEHNIFNGIDVSRGEGGTYPETSNKGDNNSENSTEGILVQRKT